MRTTVLGATGGIGRAIVTELAARGHYVTAASRSAGAANWPTGVRALDTDLRDPRQAENACRGADVVVMAAQVPYTGWATELIPLFDAALDAAVGVQAKLVVVDNLYAYGSPGTPITDTSPEAASTRKGQLRAALGQRMLAAHSAGRTRVALGRFSDYYGPGAGGSSLVDVLGIKPAVAGKTVRSFIAGDQLHTFHYLPDAARGFAVLAEQEAADGRSWILPSAPAITQGGLYGELGQVLGRELKVATVSRRMLWLAGLVSAQMREAREVVAQFDRPYTTDATRFIETFGLIEVTAHRAALAETVAWHRATATPSGSRRGATEVAA